MRPLREFVGRELQWKQDSALKRDFDLADGDESVAMLGFRSMWGSLAVLETGDGRWTFKRIGFWRTHVSVRAADSETDLGLFRNSTWSAGGTLDLDDGRTLRASNNFWATKYTIMTEDGTALLRFERIGGVFHMSAKMTIEPAAAEWPELPWLAGLGWYLAVKMHDDAGGAAAGAAAAG